MTLEHKSVQCGAAKAGARRRALASLAFEGNEFELFLADVEPVRSVRYVILLLRPGSAAFQRKLRKVIRDRGIDVGFEPWDAGRDIVVSGSGDTTPGAPSQEPEAAEAAPAGGEGN